MKYHTGLFPSKCAGKSCNSVFANHAVRYTLQQTAGSNLSCLMRLVEVALLLFARYCTQLLVLRLGQFKYTDC